MQILMVAFWNLAEITMYTIVGVSLYLRTMLLSGDYGNDGYGL